MNYCCQGNSELTANKRRFQATSDSRKSTVLDKLDLLGARCDFEFMKSNLYIVLKFDGQG